MSRGKTSGYVLTDSDIPIVLGLVARGDRDHDIAAWFGVNQGRIAEAKEGKWGSPAAAPANQLPPQGPPGIKGRRLRDAVNVALKALEDGQNLSQIKKILEMGRNSFNADEG
jgi:hypothetical protein